MPAYRMLAGTLPANDPFFIRWAWCSASHALKSTLPPAIGYMPRFFVLAMPKRTPEGFFPRFAAAFRPVAGSADASTFPLFFDLAFREDFCEDTIVVTTTISYPARMR